MTEILRSNSGTNVAVRAYSTSALQGMPFVPQEMTFALLEMTFALLEMTSALLEMTSALLEMTFVLREMLCSDVGGQFGGHRDDTP